MQFIYQTITEYCNLHCAHCYMDAGKHRKNNTTSLDDFEKIISNFPQKEIELKIGGGEIFALKNVWDYFLIIEEANKKRGSKKIHTMVQTNGYWAKDWKTTSAILNKLKKFGIQTLDISSDDKYHKEQGLQTRKLNLIDEVNYEETLIPNLLIRGANDLEEVIFPMGRAKNFKIPEDELKLSYEEFCKKSLTKSGLTIDWKGDAYMCCFQRFKLPGNVIKEPLDKIIKKSLEGELEIINNHGIEKYAQSLGWKKEDIEDIISAQGKCGLCYRLRLGMEHF